MADRMLDKLAKLLNQAEKAATPEEAEAFMTKAQTLATETSIDLAVARQHTAHNEQREQPIEKMIQLNSTGKKNARYFVDLFLAVSRANDVKCNIAQNAHYVWAFGMPSDIEVTETLYASLLFQMAETSNAYIATGAYKEEVVGRYIRRVMEGEDYWDYQRNRTVHSYEEVYVEKPMDGRVARANFYTGFTGRIERRLLNAKAEAQQAVSEQQYAVLNEEGEEVKTTGALVLKAKAVEVRDFYNATSNAKGHYKNASTSHYSSSARGAGDSAGQSARLGANKAIANRTAVGGA